MIDFLKKVQMDLFDIDNNTKQYKETKRYECIELLAYHSQQAVEKLLKYVLHNLNGVDETESRFKTHNIASLVARVESETDFIVPDDISDMANILTLWEASSRYDILMTYDQEKIDYYNQVIQNLLNSVQEYDLKKRKTEQTEDATSDS